MAEQTGEIAPVENPTVGSLFTGLRGLDLGLERAGFDIAWHSEIDPYCAALLAEAAGDMASVQFVTDPALVSSLGALAGHMGYELHQLDPEADTDDAVLVILAPAPVTLTPAGSAR